MITPKDEKRLKFIIISLVTVMNLWIVFFFSCAQCIIANDKGEIAVEIDNTTTKKIEIYNPDGTFKTAIPLKTNGEIEIYLKDNHIFVYIYRKEKTQEYDFDGNLLSENCERDLWIETKIRKVKIGDVVYKHRLVFGVDTIYRIDENGNSENILMNRADIFIEKTAFLEMFYLCVLISILSINFVELSKRKNDKIETMDECEF